MKKKIDEKKLRRLLVALMIAVVIILGGTYAWIRIGLSGSKTNVIKAGGLDLVIDETPTDGDEVRLEKAIPQSYRQGLTNKPYKFTLKNNSTIDTDYTISLEDYYVGADASLTDNDKIADNLIRYILVKNDDELVATNSKLLSTGRTIDVGTIAGKTGSEATSIPYTLYIWIDSKAGDNATEAEIMSKVFNARLKLEAEQHHSSGGSYENNAKGDYILYNPVELEYCNSTSEANCYKWLILNKLEDNKLDLIYLEDETDLTLTTSAFTILEDYTRKWNSALTVEDEYNLPATSSPAFAGYDYNKARLPQASEITDVIIDKLNSNGIADLSNQRAMLTAYNETSFGMYGYYNSPVNTQTAPYMSNATYLNGSTYYYVHPVIRVENKKIDLSNTISSEEAASKSEYPYYAYHGAGVTNYVKYKSPEALLDEVNTNVFLRYDKNASNVTVVSVCLKHDSKVSCIEGNNWDTYDTYNMEKEKAKLTSVLRSTCKTSGSNWLCDTQSAELYHTPSTVNDFWAKITSNGQIEIISYYYHVSCLSDLYEVRCQS